MSIDRGNGGGYYNGGRVPEDRRRRYDERRAASRPASGRAEPYTGRPAGGGNNGRPAYNSTRDYERAAGREYSGYGSKGYPERGSRPEYRPDAQRPVPPGARGAYPDPYYGKGRPQGGAPHGRGYYQPGYSMSGYRQRPHRGGPEGMPYAGQYGYVQSGPSYNDAQDERYLNAEVGAADTSGEWDVSEAVEEFEYLDIDAKSVAASANTRSAPAASNTVESVIGGETVFEDDFNDFDDEFPEDQDKSVPIVDNSAYDGDFENDRRTNQDHTEAIGRIPARTEPLSNGCDRDVTAYQDIQGTDNYYEERYSQKRGIREKPVQTVGGPEIADGNPREKAPQNPVVSIVLAAVLLVLAFISSFLIVSGEYIAPLQGEKQRRGAGPDFASAVQLATSNVFGEIKGQPKVYTIPLNAATAPAPDESKYGSYTDDDGVRHDTYIDETINVDVSRKRYQVNNSSTMAVVAKIKIAHPSQLRSEFAGGSFGSVRKKSSAIAKSVNAIVAINGELYNYASKNNTFLIRQGIVYREGKGEQSKKTLYIDSDGDFIIMTGIEAAKTGLCTNGEKTIFQTITFGPALVIDGEIQEIEGKTMLHYKNPRSAIGQTGPLEYMLVAVEGRSEVSKGLSCEDLAVLMKDLGCKQAYNLDGGNSSVLYYKDKPYNVVSNGTERDFGDIIYFGSALKD